MKAAALTCKDERRRMAVRGAANLHGLDYLEVSDDQLELRVVFLGKAPEKLSRENIVIEGGQRISGIRVVDLQVDRVEDEELDDSMVVTVDRPGDFSTYMLCVVEVDEKGQPVLRDTPRGAQQYQPLSGLDPRYACLPFNFKASCPSDLDCVTSQVCPPPVRVEPEISYLAKDYGSFRQLILDRLASTMPDWRERHIPDIGIALVELLAYSADYLSYYQDAVATEAYLGTARQRISVRRHAKLVDYAMHEGCNARAWVCISADTDWPLDPETTYFISGLAGIAGNNHILRSDDVRRLPLQSYEIFEVLGRSVGEPVKPIPLYADHSEIHFYTWGNRECCLATGATSATLVGEWFAAPEIPASKPGAVKPTVTPGGGQQAQARDEKDAPAACKLHVQKGDILFFEEIMGPRTGIPGDADPTHRHVVRLANVTPGRDDLFDQPIVKVEWSPEDALPFPLCISTVSEAPDCTYLENVSVARGNVVLVDHGRTVEEPPEPDTVPTETTVARCRGECQQAESTTIPGKFRPGLQARPLTFSQPLPSAGPTSSLLQQDPRQALAWIKLIGTNTAPDGIAVTHWIPRLDLLNSTGNDLHFVVEMDDDGWAHLRFGDGELGRSPGAGTKFQARYRVGNGTAGNVGAEAITCVVTDLASGVNLRPRNPLPAQGGKAPEPTAEVKLLAPNAFREKLERAITADDYASIAERNPKLQRAAATLRWTGSWYEALVALDPVGTEEASAAMLEGIAEFLYPFRRLGHDLVVEPASYVSLDLAMTVCVLPHYLRAHVEAALLDVFSNRILSDGRRGFFHPDNLTFGEGVDLSKLVAAAQAVTGVESVVVTKLQRLFMPPNHEIENGILPLGPREIARLDNDPSYPEHGKLVLIMRGGR